MEKEWLCVSALLSAGCSVGSPKPGCRTPANRSQPVPSWQKLAEAQRRRAKGKPWLENHSYQKQTCMIVLNLSAVPAGPLKLNHQVHQQKLSAIATERNRERAGLSATQRPISLILSSLEWKI